ncbi:hypothetical protein BV898_02134 [Hypsibius exemplaris]|uniref:Uncharacterized protein n=1 Tax=Hypsibius exemplaris TaxID=2072580 RepID=A0A1W0X9H9_HYPEX|nr:hypothetical protein BV898_02134 [Hypsibius exemplaris]
MNSILCYTLCISIILFSNVGYLHGDPQTFSNPVPGGVQLVNPTNNGSPSSFLPNLNAGPNLIFVIAPDQYGGFLSSLQGGSTPMPISVLRAKPSAGDGTQNTVNGDSTNALAVKALPIVGGNVTEIVVSNATMSKTTNETSTTAATVTTTEEEEEDEDETASTAAASTVADVTEKRSSKAPRSTSTTATTTTTGATIAVTEEEATTKATSVATRKSSVGRKKRRQKKVRKATVTTTTTAEPESDEDEDVADDDDVPEEEEATTTTTVRRRKHKHHGVKGSRQSVRNGSSLSVDSSVRLENGGNGEKARKRDVRKSSSSSLSVDSSVKLEGDNGFLPTNVNVN